MGHNDDDYHNFEHFSEDELRLWKRPKSIRNECSEAWLRFEICCKGYASRRGWPLSWFWYVHWAPKWQCASEMHHAEECELERMSQGFAKNRDYIDSFN